jgi:hypothetical protein
MAKEDMNRPAGLIITLVLAMTMALALPTFAGCGGKPAATPSEQELPQILDEALLAVENTESYQFTVDASTVIATTETSQWEDMNATIAMTGTADNANSEIQINYEVHLSGQLFEFQEGLNEFTGKVYSLPDWTYSWTDMYPDQNPWSKMPSTGGLNEQYNVCAQDLALLASPENIEFLRNERFDGSECHVLKVTPNLENSEKWFYDHQLSTTDIIYWTEVENDVVETAFTVWIDADTRLIKKMDANMLIDFTNAPEFDTITMGVNMQMKDYNKPVSIVLPDEAQNAEEIT